MTKMKTIFAVIFLVLLIPVLLAAPESEAKVYQGKWKNNTTWNYDTRENTLINIKLNLDKPPPSWYA